MLAIFLAALIAGSPAVRHGTDKQCAAWYPRDLVKQAECGALVLSPREQARIDRQYKVCADFLAALKRNGFVPGTITFRDGKAVVECHQN